MGNNKNQKNNSSRENPRSALALQIYPVDLVFCFFGLVMSCCLCILPLFDGFASSYHKVRKHVLSMMVGRCGVLCLLILALVGGGVTI